jgi:hypothetical protein
VHEVDQRRRDAVSPAERAVVTTPACHEAAVGRRRQRFDQAAAIQRLDDVEARLGRCGRGGAPGPEREGHSRNPKPHGGPPWDGEVSASSGTA